MSGSKLTRAQISALETVRRRDWPAGEPRLHWLHAATAKVLLARDLVRCRPGSEQPAHWWPRSPIVDLTEAGRAALSQSQPTDGDS